MKTNPQTKVATNNFLGGVLDKSLPIEKVTLLPAFSAALILDLALGSDDLLKLCEKYDITPSELQALLDHPAFSNAVQEMQNEVANRGVSFKLKAAIQADMYLQEVHKMISDNTTPASTKLDAIKSVVKWADLEPKQKDSGVSGGGGFKLVINMPGATGTQPAVTVEG